MRTLALALRNLLRNRRRSLTTLVAMVVGLATVLIFGAYTRNIAYSLETGYVLRSGHLQLQREGYLLYGMGKPAAYGIAGYERVIDVITHDPVLTPMLNVVTPTLSLTGIAGNFASGVSHTVFATGSIVEDRDRMRQWNDYDMPWHIRPSALTGTSADSAVVGLGVARILLLCEPLHVAGCAPRRSPAPADGTPAPADLVALARQEMPARESGGDARIELLAATAHGAPNVTSLRVVRAEPQGFKEFDDVHVGLHLAQAQRLLYGIERPEVTAVIVQLRHTAQMAAARARLHQLVARLGGDSRLEIHDFEVLNPFYGQAVRMFGTLFGFVAVLIGAIVLFTVSNTVSMAVVERTTEIGTLRAMGMRRSGIRRLFLCEALLLGMAAVVVGVGVALVVAWLVNHSGLTWLPPGQVIPLPLTVRLWGETTLVLQGAAGLLVVAVVSAWWPARRAGRLPIVDALRHV